MQNWEGLQHTANYDQHNSWYSSMFAASIKSEPNVSPIPSPQSAAAQQLEHYLNMKQQQHTQQTQLSAISDPMNAMVPSSPSSTGESLQHFFDSTLQQQFLQHQQQQQQQQQQHQQFQQHFQTASGSSQHAQHTLGFNPLTPPGLPSAILPPMSHFYPHSNMSHSSDQHSPHATPPPLPTTTTPTSAATQQQCGDRNKIESSLTPRNTPPMDVTPPKSPKQSQSQTMFGLDTTTSTTIGADKDHDLISNSSEDFKYLPESEDDESIRVPIYNSHGKMKNYRCKTCGLVAITKVSFWEHARSHMKPEKILQCSKCPFVTELKHHLEYHIRKHKNLKPFQCDKCSYSCVNKSMLNSHRKSHSSVYQYRCSDCDYATKYCHSFKLHLRKYDHKPGLVLDEDGAPNPSVVIDVYGTRRGPKMKSGTGSTSSSGGSRRNHHHHHHRQQQQQQQHEKIKSINSINNSSCISATELKVPTTQLSAALQGFQMNQTHLLPTSPAKSTASSSSEIQQQKETQQQQQQQQQLSNLLPPLASLLQQGHNMGFFPYWNLNLQMLAAAQQQAVLAQLSPSLRETALKNLQNQNQNQRCTAAAGDVSMNGSSDDIDIADSRIRDDDDQHDDDDDHDRERGGDDDQEDVEMIFDSRAMDLTQGGGGGGTRLKEEKKHGGGNICCAKEGFLSEGTNGSRRKGPILKLESLLKSKATNFISHSGDGVTTTTGIATAARTTPIKQCKDEQFYEAPPTPTSSSETSATSPVPPSQSVDMNKTDETDDSANVVTTSINPTTATTGAAVTAVNTSPILLNSSSNNNGNNSNSNRALSSSNTPSGTIYECKYCDIYFRDAVLYTIHMGYHSCDDVFKCNMCGEKCDGPVGLFVHMARNAHS